MKSRMRKFTVCQSTAIGSMPRDFMMSIRSPVAYAGVNASGIVPKLSALRILTLPKDATWLGLRVDAAEQQDRHDQRVDGDRFGERDADDHVQQDHAGRVWVSAHGLHGLASQDADSDARSDRSEPDCQARGQRG